jgi:hypothetical protein
MSSFNNIEHYIGRYDRQGGGRGSYSTARSTKSQSYSKGSSYNTQKSTPPIRRKPIYSSTSHTLGRIGGGPFWGWNYYPWMTVSYPFYDYAEYPEFVEYAPVEEVKKDIEVKKEKENKK